MSAVPMNRFDRVTALLLLLQTRSVVTAAELAEHFGVTERTIYRDIRTLENAGVPIGAEAGVGYFLEKGYHLPPVSFTSDEAASLLLGEKLLSLSLDADSFNDYQHALNKVRAVLSTADKDQLVALARDIEVSPTRQAVSPLNHYDAPAPALASELPAQPPLPQDNLWLRVCRGALVRRQVLRVSYRDGTGDDTDRTIEPIGLYYYRSHWHLIAWCRLRHDYRDFRLDRISRLSPVAERTMRQQRHSLLEYLRNRQAEINLTRVELLFDAKAARFTEESRIEHGFISEEHTDAGVRMVFLTASPDYLARWILQYTTTVQVLSGDKIRSALKQISQELVTHWGVDRNS